MKCYVNHIIENSDEKQEKSNIPAIYIKDESLKYIFDNNTVVIKIKKDNIIMEKNNEESKIIFDFKTNEKTEGTYLVKKNNLYINMEIMTNKIDKNDNYIYIEYELWLSSEYVGIFKYQIDIKEGK